MDPISQTKTGNTQRKKGTKTVPLGHHFGKQCLFRQKGHYFGAHGAPNLSSAPKGTILQRIKANGNKEKMYHAESSRIVDAGRLLLYFTRPLPVTLLTVQ